MGRLQRDSRRRPANIQSPEKGSGENIEIFRPRLWIRGLIVAAAAYWVSIFFALVRYDATSTKSFAGVGFFIALFTILSIFYNHQIIEVLPQSLVVRNVTSSRELRFEDIHDIRVVPGFLQTSYSVRSRAGAVSFTSMFANHQRLLALIVERAQLSRS